MKKLVMGFASVCLMASSMMASAATYVAGKDYEVVKTPVKVDVPNKIEVREFFWYGCPHCYKLEPHMQAWLRQLPKDVNFVRTPAAMNPVWEQNARGYFVSEAMGIRKRAHIPLFHTIQSGANLYDQKSLAGFYARYGANINKFNQLYNSFAITAQVSRANSLAQQYGLTGVPAVVVNGKYVIKGEDQRVIDIMNYLIEQERAAKKKAS